MKERLVRPSIPWQFVDPRVRLSYVPELTPNQVPDADAIFATAWQTAECVAGFPSSKGAKFYLIQHYETWAGPEARVRQTWKLPLNKVVIAKWLQGLAHELGEHAQYIPYGVSLSQFKLSNSIEKRDPHAVLMMYHGFDWKGSSDGLAALAKVRERCPGLEATVFGVPRRVDIPNWVTYVANPSQAALAALYNRAAIFVQPSWTEGWGLPAGEAMACGCALATTDCGGSREYADHGVTALVSPPKEPEQLANNILDLLNDQALRVRLAAAGHERIQEFTWERSADRLKQCIVDVCGNHSHSLGRPEPLDYLKDG